MSRHERPNWPPVTPDWLRHHGLIVVALGWLTLLAAALCYLLIGPPVGLILAIVFTVLGAVKIGMGMHWWVSAER